MLVDWSVCSADGRCSDIACMRVPVSWSRLSCCVCDSLDDAGMVPSITYRVGCIPSA